MKSTPLILALLSLPVAVLAQSEPSQSAPSQTREAPSAPPAMTAPAADPEEAARELAAKQQELAAITQQIGDIQARAEAAEEVKASRDKYHGALRDEMVKAAPEIEKVIDRQAQLVKELTAAASTNGEGDASGIPLEEKQKKLSEYQTLRDKLAPIEKDVQEVPVVQDSRKEYYETLIAEMQRVEPQAEALLNKRRELAIQIQQLSAQGRSG